VGLKDETTLRDATSYVVIAIVIVGFSRGTQRQPCGLYLSPTIEKYAHEMTTLSHLDDDGAPATAAIVDEAAPVVVVDDGADTSPHYPDDKKESAHSADAETTSVSDAAPPPPPNTTATTTTTTTKTAWQRRLASFYWANEFLILVVISIALAYAYPPLGADHVQPDITATWLAVIFIFLLSGLSLETSAFRSALLQHYLFHIFVQTFNFGVVSGLVYGVSRGLLGLDWISNDLANGMVVCSCLPMTISMVSVLTKAANGNEAAAVFNAALGSLLGVVLSPVLIFGYLGLSADVSIVDIAINLSVRVFLPVIVGQILRCYEPVQAFMKRHKSLSKQAQQYTLIFIVYTVFCRTFERGSDSSASDIVLMIVFQLGLLITVTVLAWFLLRVLFPREPQLRVMGLFGCMQKSVAVGVPLINAIYEDNASVGLYTMPLLIWHTLQLIVGTLLAPRLAAFVAREQERLGLVVDESNAHGGGASVTIPDGAAPNEDDHKRHDGETTAAKSEIKD
jgi:solute carrier family 10 (sodium/bile acid cotransporter), member 7